MRKLIIGIAICSVFLTLYVVSVAARIPVEEAKYDPSQTGWGPLGTRAYAWQFAYYDPGSQSYDAIQHAHDQWKNDCQTINPVYRDSSDMYHPYTETIVKVLVGSSWVQDTDALIQW